METPISKSQARAIKLLVLSATSYSEAAAALDKSGYRPDAIPAGKTWRDAAKLDDAELITAIKAVDYRNEGIDGRGDKYE